MANPDVDKFIAHLNVADASSVIAVAKDIFRALCVEGCTDEEKAKVGMEACFACGSAMVSAMHTHSSNVDVQNFVSAVVLVSLDGPEGPSPLFAEGVTACVGALRICLTSTLSPVEELPVQFNSNRSLEKTLLIILLAFFEIDEGVAMIRAGVIPVLVNNIQYVCDSESHATGDDAETLLDCKGRELDMLQCLVRAQPTCRAAVVEAGACDATLAAMKAHSSEHVVVRSGVDILNELAKDEACARAIEAAMGDPGIQEAIKLGQLTPLGKTMQDVRALLRASREAELVNKDTPESS